MYCNFGSSVNASLSYQMGCTPYIGLHPHNTAAFLAAAQKLRDFLPYSKYYGSPPYAWIAIDTADVYISLHVPSDLLD